MIFRPQRFKEIREQRGLTLKEISLALGIAESSVHNWESGLFAPRPSRIEKIATILQCDPDDLVSYEDGSRRLTAKELAMRGSAVNVELTKDEAVEAFRAGLLREFIFADMAPDAKERALKIIAEFRKKD